MPNLKELLKNKLTKLAKKNPVQAKIIVKKSKEIISNPHHYKNLRSPFVFLIKDFASALFIDAILT